MASKKQPQPQPESPRESMPGRGPLRPFCLLCAVELVVATPLVPSERAELTGTALPLVMLWLLLALVWFGGAILLRVPIARFSRIDGALLALAGWHAISGLAMMGRGAPRLTINAIWTWVGFAVALVLLRQLLKTGVEIRALCAVMLGLAVCLSTAGVYQAFVIYPQDRALYETNPEEALRSAGVSAAEGTAQRKQFEDRLYSNEPTATFSLTNSLAGFLVPWLVVLIGLAILEGRRMRKSFLIASLLGIVLVGFCLLLTKSRTAWLAAGVGCAALSMVCVSRYASRRLALVAAGGFALLVAFIAALSLAGMLEIEILTQAALSLKYRFEYWQSTLAMIFDHPLLGCGPGNFQQYYTAYKLPQASETVADPHNFLLEIAATAGLPALLLLLGVLALAVKGSGVFFSVGGNGASKGDEVKETPDPLIYAGAAAGIFVAMLLGVITGYLPAIAATLLGAAVAGVFVWLLHGWVIAGELPRWLMLLGIAVLLVNLLAAGGIGFPGVAITLIVLIAASCPAEPMSSSPNPSRPLAVAGAAIAATLLAACYFTAYRPVLESSGHLAQAAYELRRQRLDDALAELQAASAADRLSPAAEQQLASLHFHRWISQSPPMISDADYKQFDQHAQAALRLDRRAYQTDAAMGYLYLQAFARTGEPACRQEAVSLFQEAVRLYPADAMTHAQLAWMANFLGVDSGVDARREAAEALRLDQLCPHSERKLAARSLFAEIASPASADDPLASAGEKSGEQWMHEIRNKEDAQ